MKKNNYLKTSILVTLFATFIYSCNTDELDTTAPTIIINEPVNDTEYILGDTMYYSLSLKDNIELNSYKIEIHYNSDGHTHEKSAGNIAEETPFSYTYTGQIYKGAKEFEVDSTSIIIPKTISGHPVAHGVYHFGVYCSDAAGNETSVFIDIHIEE